jgi:hypothetical protein
MKPRPIYREPRVAATFLRNFRDEAQLYPNMAAKNPVECFCNAEIAIGINAKDVARDLCAFRWRIELRLRDFGCPTQSGRAPAILGAYGAVLSTYVPCHYSLSHRIGQRNLRPHPAGTKYADFHGSSPVHVRVGSKRYF